MEIQSYLYQIINITLLGNELWRFFLFSLVLFISYPIGKILSYILKEYIQPLTGKTKMKLDDIIVTSLIPTFNMFVFATMFHYASGYILQGAYTETFQRVFNFLLIIPFVYFLIKLATEMIGYYLRKNKDSGKVNETAIELLMQVIRITLIIIGVLLILANLGYDITALLTGLGVGGLAFALAAQDVLKNFFAGVALIIDGTFNKGDRIKFQNQVSFISEVKLRTTKLKTLDGTLITVPNSMLAENIVENIAHAPKYKVNINIGVVYNTSLEKLKEAKSLIENILQLDEDIDEYWVFFDNFGAYSLDIQVIYFMKYTYANWPERGIAKERINFAIKEQLEKAQIEFAFPTQTIEIKK